MLVSLKVEEQHRPALQAIDRQLKSLRFGKIILVVKDGEILDLIREERCRISDLTPTKEALFEDTMEAPF
jgi:hypothetical protein